MHWLKIVCATISICIFLYLMLQRSRLKKEFKGSIHDDRSISKRFIHRLEKKLRIEIILVIIATIFAIITFIINDLP